MDKIMALANAKGGVGKSTIATHWAAWFLEKGKTAALVDADTQGSSSEWLQEAAPEVKIFRLQSPDEILDQVPRLATEFDKIVVDGPAGLSEVTRAIMLV